MTIPHFGGRVSTDRESLERFSTDMSRYRAAPRVVVWPQSETDVEAVLDWATQKGLPVTCRGTGSNLSGSAVGEGVILVTSALTEVDAPSADSVLVGPGVRYGDLNETLEPEGRCLRYDVSSGRFSTVGGNVATKAGGLRSVKYGNVDSSVRSLRCISPVHGLVDTAGELPSRLTHDIQSLQAEIKENTAVVSFLAGRDGLKTSSGYNLAGFLQAGSAAEAVTRLMVGSVGSLGVMSRIEVTPVPIPAERRLATVSFQDMVSAAALAPDLVALEPSALEVMDALGAGLAGVPGQAVILLEFDTDPEERMDRARKVCAGCLQWREVKADEAETIWGVRWGMLTRIRRDHENENHRYLSFVDDLAVPLGTLPEYVKEVEQIFREEDLPVVIYGHIGEGNLHMRPLVSRGGWQQRIRIVADRCFDAALRRGGTLTAEHGSGRNRAPFLEREWGPEAMRVFRRIKELFDPDDQLNPGVLFSTEDFTARLQF